MVQKYDRFYPSALLEKNIDLEQRLEKQLVILTILITISTALKK